MNILICSAGRRVNLVKYFKEEVKKNGGIVVVADCDDKAPALFFADSFEIVPKIDHVEYLEAVKSICKKYNIRAIFSLIDPELTLFAQHKDEFENENIKVIISDYEVVNTCYDKYLTFTFLQEHQIPCIPTYINRNEVIKVIENGDLEFPLIAKPRNGSASCGIQIVKSISQLQSLFDLFADLIVQPFIEGEEYGIDCYIDLISSEVTNIFLKKKIRMRAGETDKSMAIKDPELTAMIKKLVNCLQPIGPIDIDCFKTSRGYLVSEINPRFGGGYPHAHELGQNFPKKIINNLLGVPNECEIDNYEEGSILIKFENHQVIHNVG